MEKRKTILVYDIATIPTGKTMNDVVEEMNNFGVVLWCSSASANFGGKENNNVPFLVDAETLEKIIDNVEFKDLGK